MSGVVKVCTQCHKSKGISAFRGGIKGSDVCIKCTNASVDHPPSKDKPRSEPRNNGLDLSHLQEAQSLYTRHLKAHPRHAKDGEWVYVIDGDPKVYTAKSYHAATAAAEKIRKGRPWYCTQHVTEKLDALVRIKTALNIQTRKVSTIAAITPIEVRNAYVERQLESYGILRNVKNQKTIEGYIVDTGATVCTIPWSLAVEMGLRAEDSAVYFEEGVPGTASAVGSPVQIYFVDIEMRIPGLQWRKARTVTIRNETKEKLLGMSYLQYTDQRWKGAISVDITDLAVSASTGKVDPSDMKESTQIKVLSGVRRSK